MRAYANCCNGAFICYLLSATPQEELRRIITQRGYNELFADVIGSPTDKVNGLLNLITHHGHRPKRTVMVGDFSNNYRAAHSNGTLFLGITNSYAAHLPFSSNTVTIPNLNG